MFQLFSLRQIYTFIVILSVCFLMACSGQKQIVQPRAVVANEGMNAVYIGLDNPISVAVDGFESGQIYVTVSAECNLKGDSGRYTINPIDPRGKVRSIDFSVYVIPKNNTDTIFVEKKSFRIKRIPMPTPYFGSKSGGLISRGEIRIVNFISVRLEDFPFDLRYNVSSFKMIFQPNGGFAQYYTTEGPRLSPEMKMVLNNVQKGDKFIIADIKIASAEMVAEGVKITEKRKIEDIHLIVK